METESRHQCMIYEGSPSQKLPILALMIQRKLAEGYQCLYLNSVPMTAGMGSTLSSIGVDVTSELEKGRLILSSEPLSINGRFDSRLMLEKLEDLLDVALNKGYKGLWASGDMTWEFGPEKDFSKLLDYELGLEEVFKRRKELSGVCQYHRDTLPQEAMRQSLLAHKSIVISDTITQINPHYLKLASHPTIHLELDQMIAVLCGK